MKQINYASVLLIFTGEQILYHNKDFNDYFPSVIIRWMPRFSLVN